MSIKGGVYASEKGYQQVVCGTDEHGELIWGTQMKAPWHLKMFPVQYGGDFSEQWMWKTLQEKGLEWESQESTEQDFARTSRKLLYRIKGGKP